MRFAAELPPPDSEWLQGLRLLEAHAQYKIAPGRDYQTAFTDPPAGAKSAFFLRLPPGTRLHPHIDSGDCITDHVVLRTNPDCLNFCDDGDGRVTQQHMEAGKRYRVNRTLKHWAVNSGKTDRVHLILEF